MQGSSSLPQQILDRRVVDDCGESVQHILVQWEKGGAEAVMWE